MSLTIKSVVKALLLLDGREEKTPFIVHCDIAGCTNPVSYRYRFTDRSGKPVFSVTPVEVCSECNDKITKTLGSIQ
jgi:hypothetical protein